MKVSDKRRATSRSRPFGGHLADEPKLQRVTLGTSVYERLRELVISGGLVPGQKLSLRMLAEQFGVSVMPVREAVMRLATEGAFQVQPNRVVRVPRMGAESFRSLTKIRIAIEGFAAAEAALGRDDKDIKAIAELEHIFRLAFRRRAVNADAATHANRHFHFAIYRAARLPPLIAIIETLWLKIGPVLNLDDKALPPHLGILGAEDHHRHLVEAIIAGDAAAARAAIAADIAAVADHILAHQDSLLAMDDSDGAPSAAGFTKGASGEMPP